MLPDQTGRRFTERPGESIWVVILKAALQQMSLLLPLCDDDLSCRYSDDCIPPVVL